MGLNSINISINNNNYNNYNNTNKFKINKMKIDNNNTEILSQITKELQNVYINNTGLESKIENICIINGD